MNRSVQAAEARAILDQRVRLTEHAVYRTFARETVVLNLRTGKYHGLNRTAGRFLEVLEQTPTVRHAVRRLAREYGLSVSEMERDVTDLCRDLRERDLVEWTDGGAG